MVKYSTVWYKNKYKERLEKAHAYLGGRCKTCLSTVRLHRHHRNPEDKLFTVTEQLHGASWSRIVAELDKCELQCEDCHKKIHQAVCGTLPGYSRGCRCDECRKANREYMKEYRNKKQIKGNVAQLVQ